MLLIFHLFLGSSFSAECKMWQQTDVFFLFFFSFLKLPVSKLLLKMQAVYDNSHSLCTRYLVPYCICTAILVIHIQTVFYPWRHYLHSARRMLLV